MAGSFQHVVKNGKYRGTDLLENMGDMAEAVEMMAFMLLSIQHRWGGDLIVPGLEREYYECCRRERSWPAWFDTTEKPTELDESGRDAPGVVYRLLSAFVAPPSDEEVEACARGLWDLEEQRYSAQESDYPYKIVPWENAHELDRAEFFGKARAAITASREYLAGLVLK